MADLETKSEEKRRSRKNKRKLSTSEVQNERDSKTSRITNPDNEKEQQAEDEDEEMEPQSESHRNQDQEGGVWDNLQLILSLQNKELDLERKVELAFNFINSSKLNKGVEDDDHTRQTVSLPRLIAFLIDWVQSVLISPDKKIRTEEACVDFRCWEIFKFCSEECLSLCIPLSFSPKLLHALSCVVKNALSKELVFSGEDYEYYSLLCDCVVLLFSHRGRLFNANVDLWVSLVTVVVDLVQKIYSAKFAGDNVGALLLRFLCLVLEPFADFLRVLPNPKIVFSVFVNRLLEPFLSLLAELYSRTDCNNSVWTGKLVKTMEDILSNGLFHPAHVDGFLTSHSMEKDKESNDGKVNNSRAIVRSYHKVFYEKLEKIMSGKVLALGGIGQLFHLFIVRVKKQKGVSVLSDVIEMTGVSGPLEKANTGTMIKFSAGQKSLISENTHSAIRLDAETSKSLFGLFVHFVEPLMLNLKKYSETTLEGEQNLLDSLSSLKSINKILSSFMQEKIYARTEDHSEGACLYFLKDIFQTVISFSTKLHVIWSSSSKRDHSEFMIMLPLLAKEIIDSVGYFLEIEYEAIENDLVSLWLIILLYSEIDLSLLDTPEKCLLTSQILHLGSQLINTYSELRQVHKSIFALCKAIRLYGFIDKDNEKDYSKFMSCKFSTFEIRVQSVTMLICSQDFRLATSNAIKSIPEGQVSGCIRELKMDISESLEWVKVCCSEGEKQFLHSCHMSSLHWKAELFGRVLSEIYTLVLDYSAVTTGNCILVGNSIKDLMTMVKPKLSCLVGKQPDSLDKFFFSVLGRNIFIHNMPEGKNNMPTLGSSRIGIFLFFFRVYMSCRSLFRQSISFMPPDLSRKASRAMGDFLTAYCGNDWMDGIDWTGGAYFSWIIDPSDFLLDIIQSVSDTCIGDNIGDCAQLIYVLHAMALQRLVDLNRQIKAFEFLLDKVVRLAGMRLMNDAGSHPCRKEQNFFETRISVLRQEAVDITNFLMTYLPVVEKKVEAIFTDNNVKDEGKEAQNSHDAWDLSICSLTEKSLPTAIWWILCQNTDIWCTHSTKKKLRKFLSILLQSSSSFISTSVDVGNQKMGEISHLRIVTMRQISLALLSDTIFYEESFLCRHLTSRFCHVLEKSVLSLFSDSLISDVDLNSIPNWPEVLTKLEDIPVVLNKEHIDHNSGMLPDFLPSMLFSMESRKQLAICQNLLSILSWMPKGRIKKKYFSVYAINILNLERLVVLNLLQYRGESCMQKQTDLFRLFLYSRRALKCLVTAYCKEKIESGQSLLIPILCESSFPILWVLRSVSVVVQLLHSCSEGHVSQVKHMIFSLMDHTSYLFLTLSKIQYRIAIRSLLNDEVPQTELPPTGEPNSKVHLIDPDTSDVWKVVIIMAETLKEQTQNLLVLLKTEIPMAKTGICFSAVDLNRLSSTTSCFQGFLWGLVSVLNDIDLMCTEERKPVRWKLPRKLFLCIDEFEDFINCCLHAIVVEEHPQPNSLCGNRGLPLSDCKEDSLSSENHRSGAGIKPSSGLERENISRRKHDLASDANDECKNTKCAETDTVRSSKTRKKMSRLVDAETAINSFNNFDSFGRQQLKIPLLQSLLSGEYPELAFLIRELFTTSSAILRLKLKIGHRSKTELKVGRCKSPSSSMAIFVWTSQLLLAEIAEMGKPPHPFSFVWLDGVIKYIEILGNYISLIDTTSSRNACTRLINIHLGVIGRCISLQGKGATLASHESESCTKTLGAQTGSSKLTLSHGSYSLDEFKARLRTSFIVLIQRPHLLTAMKALKRALVGVQEGSSMIYEIITGVPNGGKVSSIAAAGVDCFDMVLESVSGHKRLDDVKSNTEHLIGALFNIVLHLRGSSIFYGKLTGGKSDTDPDPGSVTLMCVEVLVKVAGKPSLFQMHSCHIGQSFHVPAALFQGFLMLRSPQTSSNMFPDNSDPRPITGSCSYVVDQQFSVDLFAACCRLLCTVLRHHKRESEWCMSSLQSSVCVLLHCLETVDASLAGREGDFAWKLQEGIKCASFLRRIYEEMRQQKEVLRSYCSLFLSNYISIYSGNGPCKTGIRREIDEALRPGVYALMDACSPEDFQQLHTVLGEGPCRSTLAALRRDYKQNFQYEGKV